MATASKLMGHQSIAGVAKKAIKTLTKEILKRGVRTATTAMRRKAKRITRAVKRRVPGL